MQLMQIIVGKVAARSAEPRIFRDYAAPLKEHLGVNITQREFSHLDDAAPAFHSADADVLMITPSWDMPIEALIDAIAPVYERSSRPRLLLVDWYDQTSSPHLELLRYVDLYVRRQILQDLSWYDADFAGGYAHTHFLATRMGYNLEGWHSGSRIPAGFQHRLACGWSAGADRRYEKLLHASRHYCPSFKRRPVDINARLALGDSTWGWYRRWRESSMAAVEDMTALRTRTRGRLPRRLYLLELMLSKITFSPFGWGEVCFRDFEAFCSGSLLIKPSMAHLTTSPNLYRPFETYVPVSWDLSDLQDKCEHYLAHPAEAQRIASAGRAAMADYYANLGFVRDFRRILAQLTQPSIPVPAIAEPAHAVAALPLE